VAAEGREDAASLRLVYELACSFAASIDLDELVPLVVHKCREIFTAEAASVMLLDPARDELFFYTVDDTPGVVAKLREVRIPAGRGIAGAVLRSGKTTFVNDAAADPRFYSEVDRRSGSTTRTLLCAPLRTSGAPLGVVQVVNGRLGSGFAAADGALLEALGASIAVAIENARAHGRVKESEERLRAQVVALRRDLARHDRFGDLIGHSGAMRELFRLMESAAAAPIAVLVTGETGVGKELVARGVHRASGRADGPFVPVNCAAIPDTMLERELFGHRKGAFTDATQDQRGLFEAASDGTIFLDGIGDMPRSMQAKLLRVLQEGEVVPLGDQRARPVDVRVVSATNRDLEAAVADGTFRQDLFYRLAAFPLAVPPLRARREDVPILAHHFLSAAATRLAKPVAELAAPALALLERYDWPGNVRELQNEIERAVAVAPGGAPIDSTHLSPRLQDGRPAAPLPAAGAAGDMPGPLREARTAFEAAYIRDALACEGGNVTKTAERLELSRAMLQRKMKAYGLRGR
jgi:Nif-specific regulatory protein